MAAKGRLISYGCICIDYPGSQRDQVTNAGMLGWNLPWTGKQTFVFSLLEGMNDWLELP